MTQTEQPEGLICQVLLLHLAQPASLLSVTDRIPRHTTDKTFSEEVSHLAIFIILYLTPQVLLICDVHFKVFLILKQRMKQRFSAGNCNSIQLVSCGYTSGKNNPGITTQWDGWPALSRVTSTYQSLHIYKQQQIAVPLGASDLPQCSPVYHVM